MIFPVILQIIQSNGDTKTVQLPVEIWQRGDEWVYKYPSTQKIYKVILDPQQQLPDTNRNNNEWKR